VLKPIDHGVGFVSAEFCADQAEEVCRALFLFALALTSRGKRDGALVILLFLMFNRGEDLSQRR
jgi:hypothetical protein